MIQDTRKRYSGPKMPVGRIILYSDQKTNRQVCVMAGYCPGCSAKVLLTLDEAKALARRYSRSCKRPRYRLLLWALRKITYVDAYEKELDLRIAEKDRRAEKLLTQY